ncbi:hypothetical protein [Ensifer aridi]|uniref:hypothetical protein n=1 Tax=Ensifer aridi TaxID=1708715 RepID=UPI000406BAA3|nr:hypothetical protein [Ensifer aridi]
MNGWFFDPLLPLHYEMIVIDIPWPFDLYSDAGAKKSASAQYDVMNADRSARFQSANSPAWIA